MSNSMGLYTIEGFNTERGQGMGNYGFSIILAESVVTELLYKKRESGEQLTDMLQSRIVNSDAGYGLQRINYFEDTWLLTDFSIGGDCACFGIDGYARSELKQRRLAVRYSPHNIDTPHQASVVLSTWLLWFNAVIRLTEFQQPYAI